MYVVVKINEDSYSNFKDHFYDTREISLCGVQTIEKKQKKTKETMTSRHYY
jgi:hypothetical protein